MSEVLDKIQERLSQLKIPQFPVYHVEQNEQNVVDSEFYCNGETVGIRGVVLPVNGYPQNKEPHIEEKGYTYYEMNPDDFYNLFSHERLPYIKTVEFKESMRFFMDALKQSYSPMLLRNDESFELSDGLILLYRYQEDLPAAVLKRVTLTYYLDDNTFEGDAVYRDILSGSLISLNTYSDYLMIHISLDDNENLISDSYSNYNYNFSIEKGVAKRSFSEETAKEILMTMKKLDRLKEEGEYYYDEQNTVERLSRLFFEKPEKKKAVNHFSDIEF